MLVTTETTGIQEQERSVRLVGLGNEEIAAAEARIGTGGIQAAADDEGRVETAFGQNRGDEAGRRRLAHACRRWRCLLEAHQLGQHLRPRDDRHLLLARGDHLRVVGLDRRRDDDGIGAGDVGSPWPTR